MKIRQNAEKLLKEQFEIDVEANGNSFSEYVQNESENDPEFFAWLFDEMFESDFDTSLSEEHIAEFKKFLETIKK